MNSNFLSHKMCTVLSTAFVSFAILAPQSSFAMRPEGEGELKTNFKKRWSFDGGEAVVEGNGRVGVHHPLVPAVYEEKHKKGKKHSKKEKKESRERKRERNNQELIRGMRRQTDKIRESTDTITEEEKVFDDPSIKPVGELAKRKFRETIHMGRKKNIPSHKISKKIERDFGFKLDKMEIGILKESDHKISKANWTKGSAKKHMKKKERRMK